MTEPHRAYTKEEAHDLEVHVARCEERYKTLFDRLKTVENWIKAAVVGLIGGMGTIIALLLNRVFSS